MIDGGWRGAGGGEIELARGSGTKEGGGGETGGDPSSPPTTSLGCSCSWGHSGVGSKVKPTPALSSSRAGLRAFLFLKECVVTPGRL